MARASGALLVSALAAACGRASGVDVALDELLVTTPTAGADVATCTQYPLGSGQGSVIGRGIDGITVEQQLIGAEVIVEVKRDDVPFVQRRYDEAFFRSGAVDQFVVLPSGATRLQLTYRGQLVPPGCPPITRGGP